LQQGGRIHVYFYWLARDIEKRAFEGLGGSNEMVRGTFFRNDFVDARPQLDSSFPQQPALLSIQNLPEALSPSCFYFYFYQEDVIVEIEFQALASGRHSLTHSTHVTS